MTRQLEQANTLLDTVQKGYVVGIDLGGTNIKGALLDLKGRILLRRELATKAELGPEGVSQRITSLALDLIKEYGIGKDKVIATGMGVPGQIDCTEGCVLRSGNLCWEEVYLVGMVGKELEMPVFIENDATAAALGEKWLGAGREAQNCIMLTVGTGIGGGIIVEGKVYRGASGYGGEIGHMIIQADGPKCSCGSQGCLEALTAAPAIINRARRALENVGKMSLVHAESLQVKDIFTAAAKGDQAAKQVIEETAYYLGIGIGNLVNIFNPDVVIVGGGVAGAGDVLFEPLRKYAYQYSLPAPRAVVRIVPAQLGNDAGFLGAAAVALQGLGY